MEKVSLYLRHSSSGFVHWLLAIIAAITLLSGCGTLDGPQLSSLPKLSTVFSLSDELHSSKIASSRRSAPVALPEQVSAGHSAEPNNKPPAFIIVGAEAPLGDESSANDDSILSHLDQDLNYELQPTREVPKCATSSGDAWGRPRDEYVCDGGDSELRARVSSNWSVDGIELEDTVAHFDTLKGDVEIVASNRSCVYSPKFAAVRQVRRVHENEVHSIAASSGAYQATAEHVLEEETGAVKQPIGAVRAVGTAIGMRVEQHDRGILIDDVDQPLEKRNQLLPYENMELVLTGELDISDGPKLIESAGAALAWSTVTMAQVTIDNGVAFERTGVRQGQEAVVYEMPKGKPRLRLVKLASECAAASGEKVQFTIRFDNIGDEPIGNVTIIDLLTTRLEYVDKSQSCTVDGEFFTEDERDALKLKWEIDEPLDPGQGGVIRFECIVR